MDLSKANYMTLVKLGTINDLKAKLTTEKAEITNIMNEVDDSGISLLERALIARKFDIAKYLIESGTTLNIISNEGFNELHYIAANINQCGAVDTAMTLITMGVNLDLVDKKFKNIAAFSLCLEIFKKRSTEGMELMKEILKRKPNLDSVNISGISLRSLLLDRGTSEMIDLIKEAP